MIESNRTVSEVLESYVPYDGPHTPGSVVEAARAVAHLVRYLNNATQHEAPVRYAVTVHEVLGGIGGALHGLDQLLQQLGSALRRHDPTLYDDRHDRPGGSTAEEAADKLIELRLALAAAARTMDATRGLTSHLGNDGGEDGE